MCTRPLAAPLTLRRLDSYFLDLSGDLRSAGNEMRQALEMSDPSAAAAMVTDLDRATAAIAGAREEMRTLPPMPD